MQIHSEENNFKKVYVILETQEEVDQLYSILNFNPITNIFYKNNSKNPIQYMHEHLRKFRSHNYKKFHNWLDERLMGK